MRALPRQVSSNRLPIPLLGLLIPPLQFLVGHGHEPFRVGVNPTGSAHTRFQCIGPSLELLLLQRMLLLLLLDNGRLLGMDLLSAPQVLGRGASNEE